jgi:peroxiredoxin
MTSLKSLVLIAWIAFDPGFSSDPTEFVGKRIPVFSARATDSTVISPAFFDSKVSIITFYSWRCLPCRHEVPVLLQLAGEFAAKDFNLVIITDDDPKTIRKHFTDDDRRSLSKSMFRFDRYKTKIVCDRDRVIYDKFEIKPIPALFIVDKKGVIRDYFPGFSTNDQDKTILYQSLREKIEKLKTE